MTNEMTPNTSTVPEKKDLGSSSEPVAQTPDLDKDIVSAENDPGQPLIQHLVELRNRLLRCVVIVLALFIGLYYFANDIYNILSAPLQSILPTDGSLIATGVTSPFMVPLKLTLVVSVFIAIPFILHQIWSFIAPGLYRHEKRLAFPLLFSSIVLFYLGVAFAYFVVLPLVFFFFANIGPENIAVMPDINNVLNFALKLFFAFGISFEIPVATYLCVFMGVTTVEALKVQRPYVIVGCFCVGMLITPPDILSQTVLAVPMWLLFEVGLLASATIKKS